MNQATNTGKQDKKHTSHFFFTLYTHRGVTEISKCGKRTVELEGLARAGWWRGGLMDLGKLGVSVKAQEPWGDEKESQRLEPFGWGKGK